MLRDEVDKLPKRIKDKILFSGRCWNWTGAKSNGYGSVWWRNKSARAHKVIYELIFGKIRNGLILDHLCRNKLCVNPHHLDEVTHKENTHRGIGPTAINAHKTHCPKGHPYSEKNTFIYVRDGYTQRCCKTCTTMKNRSKTT